MIPPIYQAEEMAQMPVFLKAISQEAQDILTTHSKIPNEVRFVADMRRWVLIHMAIAIHFEHKCDPQKPRLSPKTLYQSIQSTGIASRNTVHAFLQALTRVQLTELPPSEKIRHHAPKISRKTERLIGLYFDIHLRALDTLDGCQRSLYLRQNQSMLSRLQPTFARGVCLSPQWFDPPEDIRCFSYSASGSSILHELLLAAGSEPPDRNGRIWIDPIATPGFAQRYQVSTAHVSRMLMKANDREAIGWSRPGRRGDCWISERLRKSYLRWQAEKLSTLSVAFREASKTSISM
ncbi:MULTISPECIES: hypothetical protein [unclassified Yoonia]|uniref:hypothetical protein n=1 Tax=unclassified Yoonia TaxID=2629118 RepID=UPI002AFFE73B|nr:MULTISPECIES: hypothetical protein [unclassified Yoonia]